MASATTPCQNAFRFIIARINLCSYVPVASVLVYMLASSYPERVIALKFDFQQHWSGGLLVIICLGFLLLTAQKRNKFR